MAVKNIKIYARYLQDENLMCETKFDMIAQNVTNFLMNDNCLEIRIEFEHELESEKE